MWGLGCEDVGEGVGEFCEFDCCFFLWGGQGVVGGGWGACWGGGGFFWWGCFGGFELLKGCVVGSELVGVLIDVGVVSDHVPALVCFGVWCLF